MHHHRQIAFAPVASIPHVTAQMGLVTCLAVVRLPDRRVLPFHYNCDDCDVGACRWNLHALVVLLCDVIYTLQAREQQY